MSDDYEIDNLQDAATTGRKKPRLLGAAGPVFGWIKTGMKGATYVLGEERRGAERRGEPTTRKASACVALTHAMRRKALGTCNPQKAPK